ncbi:hypothetical protein [Bacillus sp. RCC_6_1]|uniref:hypothetical protein n=1 Tax=Bacillus sp. RCC_6_1 TaxID=3239229 RepID=UPI0035264532
MVDDKNSFQPGIYAIINKKMKMVYVGETEEAFLIRWIEHISRIPSFFENADRTILYLDQDTKYIILKELNKNKFTTKDFYRFEHEAMEFYKSKGWNVTSKSHFKESMKDNNYLKKDNEYTRYKRAIKHMIKSLGLINTKNNNVGLLYSKLYEKINKHFETDVYKRSKGGVLNNLTKEELQFIILDLYPRFREKMLALYRVEYAKQEIQLNLF